MTVGSRIRAFREAAGMTQAQLAEKVGMSEPAIRLYELGKRHPRQEAVSLIAEALGVDRQALSELGVESARDALEVLFRLEDSCGLVPGEGGALSVDPSAENAQKLDVAIRRWAERRRELDEGSITRAEYDAWRARVR